jgi:hydroxypyruvate isomerase
MTINNTITEFPRRQLLTSAAAIGVAAGCAVVTTAAASSSMDTPQPTPSPTGATKKRLKQSVCRWCFGSTKLEDLCKLASSVGLASVELLSEKEWHIPAQFGLTCAVANGPVTINKGINRPDSHDAFIKESERLLPLVKAANIPSMIVFSGNRAPDLSDADGLKNCATALKRITPLAESLGITIIMELLNSKVDHKGYMCDRTPWGVELVNQVASDRFKLLYDIYHMQIMEGDVIRTITDHAKAIAHYHTAGVPGRRDLDDKQELNYKAICEAIVATGYTGYLGQEFMPKADPAAALAAAATICDV